MKPPRHRPHGDRYGRHRVLAPEGALPQAASRLDNSLPLWDNELLVRVETLNIDSASFRQMRTAAHGDPEGVARQVLANVAAMGKQQNPVTGSGGMLLGTVEDMGPAYSNPAGLHPGDPVCTLVSLTLTPLHLERIRHVRDSEQLDVDGHAVVFDTGVLARIPHDVPLRVCLALLDVAGAPAQADRLARADETVYVMGAGKSALLCAAAIRQKLGHGARVLVSDIREDRLVPFRDFGLADRAFTADALNPSETREEVAAVTDGRMADLVINTANVVGTELTSVLACRPGGRVYFFNMATRFQMAALGAEGVGMDVQMIIGNGYAPGHAEFTLNLYRRDAVVRRWFDAHFG